MHVYRRIEITIPLTKETLNKIDDYIIELRDKFKGVRWSTFSPSEHPLESVFCGWGLNKKGKFELDRNIVIFTDVNPEDVHIEMFVKELKNRMEESFEPQEIWIIMHDITSVK